MPMTFSNTNDIPSLIAVLIPAQAVTKNTRAVSQTCPKLEM